MNFLLIINGDIEESTAMDPKDAKTEWDEDYVITSLCYGCRKCVLLCPRECILGDSFPFYIDSDRCIRCGTCADICPVNAVQLI